MPQSRQAGCTGSQLECANADLREGLALSRALCILGLLSEAPTEPLAEQLGVRGELITSGTPHLAKPAFVCDDSGSKSRLSSLYPVVWQSKRKSSVRWGEVKRKLVRLKWDNWKSRGKAVNYASLAWFSYHIARMDEVGQRPADEKQDEEGSRGEGRTELWPPCRGPAPMGHWNTILGKTNRMRWVNSFLWGSGGLVHAVGA